jgi:hypothetical protein
MPAPPVPPAKSSTSRNRRGGGGRSRPSAQAQDATSVDGEEGELTCWALSAASQIVLYKNRWWRRSRAEQPALWGALTGRADPGATRTRAIKRHGEERMGPSHLPQHPPASFSRTYSSSHQQQQQPLLTSWGLPDYLAHLEHTLPSKTPRPLQLRGSGEERGVRVRWPGKRMSVGDMNKRVRALVEWVGREQASASERYRRREALQAALGDPASFGVLSVGDSAEMIVDGAPPPQPPPPPPPVEEKIVDAGGGEKSTMKMMEELMEELIVFQERYGPGAKSKDRRTAVLS